MKTKECPSCAMDVDTRCKVCPICAYEFTNPGTRIRWTAIVLVLIILVYLMFR